MEFFSLYKILKQVKLIDELKICFVTYYKRNKWSAY